MSEAPKKKKNPLLPVTVILSACLLSTIFLCVLMGVWFFFSDKKEKNEDPSEVVFEFSSEIPVTYTEEEMEAIKEEAHSKGQAEKETEIKELLREEAENTSPSLATVLRKMFPECIVFPGDGRFYFESIDEEIPANTYKKENYVTDENGYRFYEENGSRLTSLCIDISAHQGAVDWPKVAGAGVKRAMIRAGYRGYGSGKMVEDDYAKANLEGATANGIEAGVYFFSQAITEEEVDEEVQVILELIEPYGIKGPVAIDVEKLDDASARGNALSADERTALVKRFCDKVKEAGYEPMIYGNAYSLFHMLNYKEISEYPIWFAYYSDSLYFPYQPAMWQYSSTGRVPGINGNVDLNVNYKTP